MSKRRILIQIDPDRHASVFDSVVAVDSEVDHLLRYSGVRAEDVTGLVHGAMFTRGPDDLRHTAIFIGGANVQQGEELLEQVKTTFFGPLRVSVMLDANGANTTAAAAIVAASRHLSLADCQSLVLAGTGPVGQRVARLLAGQGARVRIASRDAGRAAAACDRIGASIGDSARLSSCEVASDSSLGAALENVELVVAAGAAGVVLLPATVRQACDSLRVAVDLNAVPPVGIEGIEVTDTAAHVDRVIGYGAIGIGGTKMRIHKAAVRQLFHDREQILDAEEILRIGYALDRSSSP